MTLTVLSRPNKLRFAALVVASTVLAGSCRYTPPRERELDSDVVQHGTPEWHKALYRSQYGPGRLSYFRPAEQQSIYLCMRYTANEDFAGGVAYVYDIIRREFSRVELADLSAIQGAEWKWALRAAGRTSPAPVSVPLGRELWCIVGDQEGLSLRGECVVTEGRSLTGIRFSPSQTLAAVVSADGRHEVTMGNFLGRGGPTPNAYGQHYLQVLAFETSRFLGRPVAIGVESARSTSSLDWLGGDDLIGITPRSGEWISIVHIADTVARDGAR